MKRRIKNQRFQPLRFDRDTPGFSYVVPAARFLLHLSRSSEVLTKIFFKRIFVRMNGIYNLFFPLSYVLIISKSRLSWGLFIRARLGEPAHLNELSRLAEMQRLFRRDSSHNSLSRVSSPHVNGSLHSLSCID